MKITFEPTPEEVAFLVQRFDENGHYQNATEDEQVVLRRLAHKCCVKYRYPRWEIVGKARRAFVSVQLTRLLGTTVLACDH